MKWNTYSFKAYKENEEKIDEEIFKLFEKAKKMGFTLKSRKTYLDDGRFPRVKFDFIFDVAEIKYTDKNGKTYKYVATLTRENPKLKGKKGKVKMETLTKVKKTKKHKLSDTSVGNQVFAAKKYEGENFSKYFKAKFRCDHCGANRYRLKVYLFRDSKGKEKMIATACSKEYFGVRVDTMLRNLAGQVKKIEKYITKVVDRDYNHYEFKYNTEDHCERRYDSILRYSRKDVKSPAKFDFNDLLKFSDTYKEENPKSTEINNMHVALRQFAPNFYYLNEIVRKYVNSKYVYVAPKVDSPMVIKTSPLAVGRRVTTKGKIKVSKKVPGKFGMYYFNVVNGNDGKSYGVNTGYKLANEGDVVLIDGVIKNTSVYYGKVTYYLTKVFARKV